MGILYNTKEILILKNCTHQRNVALLKATGSHSLIYREFYEELLSRTATHYSTFIR